MGKDKVFLHIRNETFIERLYFGGQKYFDRILISSDTEKHAEEIRLTLKESLQIEDIEILTDTYPDTGPLGALCTLFEETDLDHFALIPVDVPNASMEFLLEQYAKIEMQDPAAGGKPILIAESADGKFEPLIGIYTRKAYPVLKEALEKGDNKVIRVISGHFEAVRLNAEQKKAFRNVNTKTDYKELEE